VVLVGADHSVDVPVAVAVDPDARGPVASRLDDELTAWAGCERVVTRPVQVARCGPCDVGDDVLFELPGADPDEPARTVARGGRRDVDALGGRLPRKAGTPPAEPARLLDCGRQAAHPVLEHRASGSWMCGREEREDEDVAVPEDVAPVPGT
jgi:hypothetical protein